MILNTKNRLQELEEKFSRLEPELKDTPEKEAISILHAMIQESRQTAQMERSGLTREDEVTLESVANLYKTAPKMEGKAEKEGLPVGTPAPDFTLPDQDGNPVSLSAYRGKNVVLVFYPLVWALSRNGLA